MQCFFSAIAHTLLDSIWQTLIVAGMLALLLRLEGKRNAALRHLMAWIALVVLCIWVGNTFVKEYYEAVSLEEMLGRFAFYGVFEANIPAESLLWWENARCWSSHYAAALALLWLMGFGLYLARLLGSYGYLTRTQWQYSRYEPSTWEGAAQLLAKRMGIRRRISVRLSHQLAVPMVIGYLRPIVVLPASLVSGMSAAQVEAILAHELAHVLRCDFLLNLLLSLTDAVFFYHPAYWWLARTIRIEREHACDDIALAHLQSRLLYARTLADVEAFALQPVYCAQSGKPRLGLFFGGSQPCLLPRIQRIFQPKNNNHFQPMKRILPTTLLLSAVAVGMWVKPSNATDFGAARGCSLGSLTMAVDTPPPPVAPIPPDAALPPLPPLAPLPPQKSNQHITLDTDGDGTPEVDVAYNRDAIKRQQREAMERARMEIERAKVEIQQEMLRIRRETKLSARERERICEELQRAQSNLEMQLNNRQMERNWEQFGREMERFGEEMGRWGERFGRDMERWAEDFERSMEGNAAAQSQELKAVERTLRQELEADGLIKPHQRIEIELQGNQVILNGSPIPQNLTDKYLGLIEAAAN